MSRLRTALNKAHHYPDYGLLPKLGGNKNSSVEKSGAIQKQGMLGTLLFSSVVAERGILCLVKVTAVAAFSAELKMSSPEVSLAGNRGESD